MSEVYLINGDTLSNIADAIRDKKGTSDAILVENMAEEISGIGGGDIKRLLDKSITSISDNSITTVGINAFYNCTALKTFYFPKLTTIGASAFYNCSSLVITYLPLNCTSIGKTAFYGCTSLTSITFHTKPISGMVSVFQNCTNLKVINVPWSEGEVIGAPWGATNATINYNYTGG